MVERKLFTSESVTEGHPDKLCDQLSDAILDAIIKEDPLARVACETACTTGLVIAMGEITTTAYADIQHIVREVVRDVGYLSSDMGFDANTCAVLSSIHEQSPDISMGVDQALEARGSQQKELGAGDQGMMFGYACDQTPVLMPLGCVLAHNLAKQLTAVRKAGTLPYLRPDGKSQVSIVMEGDVPKYVDGVVVSSQHDPDVTQEQLRQDILDKVIRPVLPANLWDEQTKLWVNPTGRFVVGGPHGDSGLTGRKIIVDTYGGYARHGGGAFSGKDPTKVDRSGAYMARYIAKNLVAAGLAKRLEMQISYAIGVAQPVSINVEAFGSSKYSNEQLQACVRKTFDMRPGAIIERLQLRRPIYRQTAAYGHFGRADLQLPWEQVDQVEAVRKNIE